MIGKTLIFWIVWLILILPNVILSQIISSEKILGRYQQFVWQDQHGLPQNGISAIVQTPDGYLWMAIAEGVVRFDGVRFTPFDMGNTPEIESNNVQSLLVDRSGTLWIGTHGGGLTRYKDGKFSHFSTAEGLAAPYVKCLFEDSLGNIWIGTDGGGLNLFRDGKFTAYTITEGLPDNRITALSEDKTGAVWIGTQKGLAKFKDGKFESSWGDAETIFSLFRDKNDEMWISGGNGLRRLKNGEVTTFGEKEGLKESPIVSIAQDRNRTLWFGTKEIGLYRFEDNRFELISTKAGLINDDIQAIFADTTGDIWLGTSGGGLAQLKTGRIKTYTTSEGLAGNMVNGVLADSKGAIWIGTDKGLSRFKDGKFTTITLPNGEPIRDSGSIFEDNEGNLWVSSNTNDRILKFDEKTSKVEIILDKFFDNQAAVVVEDKKGNAWFGTSYNGLHRIEEGGHETIFHKKEGLADEYVNALHVARDGSLWVGTRGGLSRFKDGVLKTFTAQEGWKGGHVLSFLEDSRGNFWIGTHGDGLFRWRDGKFDVFTAKNGLYDGLAFQILEDDNGNLWMSGNKGIYRVSIAELEDFAAGRRKSVNSFSYSSFDGMLSRECNSANPAGAKAGDGKLWFPTIKGVVVIDPKITDEKQPLVNIEEVLIDNQPLPNGVEVKVYPNQSDLEIQFTALSWNRPSQIKFKYQLVGLDEDWVDSGTRRTAYYPHIPAGEYTFRVIADNGEGVWNNEGKSLKVTVLPPFYQTWWFYLLCAVIIALIVRLIYSYRVSQLRQINEAKTLFTQQLIENQEQERRRIAVELHDSIGQSLIVIRNRALMGLNASDKPERLVSQMEEISESAAETITEVRRISHNLHPYQLEHLGLTTAIETMIEATDKASPIEFEKEIDDIDDVLSREAEINLYRITQESINNILKHSEATKAKITIHKNLGVLDVLIRDNGKGFNPESLTTGKGGLGLTGISERAKMLGAKHEIASVQGEGTTISLQIGLNSH